ncbi:polysaccharide biosynthesis C-terminal domain-containing protein [Halosimplex aquaticum]|uniref:Polysaccharide biosynthesis C-terminal domain-containing protein n=1 Tax=Halosimplex aquaticum TaxID=3026162 RepID=A0ABD5Y393_9EURY|nr:polysaccharide biosynthesis C-terminal domain-containing protein [Halosimplex aquaticum]
MRRDRTAVLHFAAQVARSLAGFGTTLLAAQYFGAAGLGIYSQVLALLFWLKLPSNSIKTAVSKRMSETEDVTGHFSAGLVAALGYGVLVGVVVFLFESYVNGYLNADAAHLLVFLLAANMVFDHVKSGFVGRKRVAVSGWLGTAEQILRLASQLAFVLGGAMVIGLVTGHLVSLAVFGLIGLFLLRRHLTIPDLGDFDDLRRYAQYSWLGNLQGLALTWMDILVLGLFVGDSQVGIYQASWTLASFLALTSKSIGKTLFPELSDLGTDERYDRARSLVGDGLLFAGVFLIPGAFGALVIGDRILDVYSAEFSAGATILVILIAARTVHAFGSQFVNTLNGLDYPEIAFRVNAAFFATNISLNVLLVYLIGWYGAAIATLASTTVYLAVSWFELRGEVGAIDVPLVEIGYELVASVAMAGVVWSALPYLPRNVFATVGAVFLGAAVYGAIILLLSTKIRGKVLTLVGT